MANPFPFTAGQVLTAAEMNGIGEALTYTPTYGNFTLGNGTVVARYVRVQKLVYVGVKIVCGTTTAVTGTSPSLTIPITAQDANSNRCFGTVWWFDSSAGLQVYGPISGATNTQVGFNAFSAGGTYVGISYATSTTPFILATGDVIEFAFTYEAA